MHIHRRGLLIGGAAVIGGLTLGTVAERRGWWDVDLLGSPDPDDAIARVSRGSEALLVRAYDAVLAEPALALAPYLPRLVAYRQHHLDHLAALGGGSKDVAAATAPGQPEPDQSGAAPATGLELPTDPAAVPAYFAALEQQRAGQAATGVRITSAGGLARLQALIVTSETTHAVGWRNG